MEPNKTTFWPMVGGISEGFANYLGILREVDAQRPTRQSLEEWLTTEYGIKHSYARNIVSLLLFGTGLLESEGKCCQVTSAGKDLLKSGAASLLYEMVASRFIGIDNIISIVEQRQPISGEDLQRSWESEVRQKWSVRWNDRHASIQFKHRLDWLRSLGMINKVADGYYLAKAGIREVTRRRVQAATGEGAAEKVSHSDIEDKLTAIGEFFEFVSIKRAMVNEARPTNTPRLSENRQLDCLWARVIQFGGKVQYAFEVQLSGSISDAIERLEMVASFVQKGVVVTDEEQQARIEDRLAVKNSPLRDKILFLSYEDIDNVVEAVNALRVFTKKIFRE
jgi:hypothetical protein